MKKISIVIALVLTTLMLSGCVLMVMGAVEAGTEIIGSIAEEAAADKAFKREKEEANRAAAEAGRKRTLDEHMWGRRESPFIDKAEERLLRRTSELAGGTQVDPTPYLLHQDSFAVMEDEIWNCKTIIDIESQRWAGDGQTVKHPFSIFEIAVTATFEVNKQPNKMDLTAVTCARSASAAKNSINKYIWKHIANENELNVDGMTNRKLQYNNIQTGNTKMLFYVVVSKCEFVPLFVEDAEPGYYQFDVEVEYQKTKPTVVLLFTTGSTTFETFENVYRSDFKTLAAATLEAQAAIWNDARKMSSIKKELPLPIINFVKAEKYK